MAAGKSPLASYMQKVPAAAQRNFSMQPSHHVSTTTIHSTQHRSTCTDAIPITYHDGLSIIVTGRPTDVLARAGSRSRRGEITIHIASRESDLDQPNVDALTDAILALFTLASTRSSSAFASQIWLRKHTVVHTNQFPNNIRAAVTFAVAVANRFRPSTVATEKATAIYAKRLHSIVRRGAGERAMGTLLVNSSSMHDISNFDSERHETDIQDHRHAATSDVATDNSKRPCTAFVCMGMSHRPSYLYSGSRTQGLPRTGIMARLTWSPVSRSLARMFFKTTRIPSPTTEGLF
jgi:hypothetical protein